MTFNYDRVRDFHDKRLLKLNVDYFKTFVAADADGMRDMQTKDFFITDIPLGLVKLDRDQWHDVNAEFTSNTYDSVCTALSLEGLYSHNHEYAVTILENFISFKMKYDYPDNSGQFLPPNLKAGDTSSMIMCSVIWWNKDGKVIKDLEYGRYPWKNFSLAAWDRAPNYRKASSGSDFKKTLQKMGECDDRSSFVKEKVLLPFPRATARKSIFSRAGSWFAKLFRF